MFIFGQILSASTKTELNKEYTLNGIFKQVVECETTIKPGKEDSLMMNEFALQKPNTTDPLDRKHVSMEAKFTLKKGSKIKVSNEEKYFETLHDQEVVFTKGIVCVQPEESKFFVHRFDFRSTVGLYYNDDEKEFVPRSGAMLAYVFELACTCFINDKYLGPTDKNQRSFVSLVDVDKTGTYFLSVSYPMNRTDIWRIQKNRNCDVYDMFKYLILFDMDMLNKFIKDKTKNTYKTTFTCCIGEFAFKFKDQKDIKVISKEECDKQENKIKQDTLKKLEDLKTMILYNIKNHKESNKTDFIKLANEIIETQWDQFLLTPEEIADNKFDQDKNPDLLFIKMYMVWSCEIFGIYCNDGSWNYNCESRAEYCYRDLEYYNIKDYDNMFNKLWTLEQLGNAVKENETYKDKAFHKDNIHKVSIDQQIQNFEDNIKKSYEFLFEKKGMKKEYEEMMELLQNFSNKINDLLQKDAIEIEVKEEIAKEFVEIDEKANVFKQFDSFKFRFDSIKKTER